MTVIAIMTATAVPAANVTAIVSATASVTAGVVATLAAAVQDQQTKEAV